jgi:hypothetical protein
MMALINSWFAQTTASQDYQRSDYIVLWLILMVGVFVRFWGLGNVGLHGDEETMAMPAMAILESGQPLLPSGMFYSRALLNIYAMAGSVWIFGESEWAFRLPSAVVGSLAGLAAFFLGRRFLSPQVNLAFVATITLLPGMIEVSQTARMYAFFATCAIWFGACLFRWERDQRVTSLILALLVWLLCLHFHRLAILAAPLFLFPGLSQRSWNLLIQGAAAFAIGWLSFRYYTLFVGSKYPPMSDRPMALEESVPQTAFELLTLDNTWLVLASIVAIAVLIGVLLIKVVKLADWQQAMPVLLVGVGLLAMAVLHYHVGGILLMLGLVFWLRAPSLPRSWLLVSLLLAAIMTLVHLTILHDTGVYPGRKLIGAIVGTPSVWPVLRLPLYSPVAGAVYCAVLLFTLTRFTRGRPMPMHILLFIMAVWVPLLIIGYFSSYIPLRYGIGQIIFLLLCTFAGVAYVAQAMRWTPADSRLPRPMTLLLALVTVALVNPIALARSVNSGYALHPDHKGAAEFIQSLDLEPDTILIAEDVLQQTYYLGRVDYWLTAVDNVRRFSIVRNGRIVDQYTATPIIGSGEELTTVLDAAGQSHVYIVGSGENFVDGERLFRGDAISDILKSDRLEIVFTGRDEKTKIWKLRTSNAPSLK